MRPAPERASDVPLLQWLEVLRELRRIPDARPDEVLPGCSAKSKASPRRAPPPDGAGRRQAPPRARAVLGALLELQADKKGAASLRATLNPLTTYRLGLSAEALPNALEWNIQ